MLESFKIPPPPATIRKRLFPNSTLNGWVTVYWYVYLHSGFKFCLQKSALFGKFAPPHPHQKKKNVSPKFEPSRSAHFFSKWTLHLLTTVLFNVALAHHNSNEGCNCSSQIFLRLHMLTTFFFTVALAHYNYFYHSKSVPFKLSCPGFLTPLLLAVC